MGLFWYFLGFIFVGISALFLIDQKSKRDARTKAEQEKKELALASNTYEETLRSTHNKKKSLRE